MEAMSEVKIWEFHVFHMFQDWQCLLFKIFSGSFLQLHFLFRSLNSSHIINHKINDLFEYKLVLEARGYTIIIQQRI